MSIPRPEYPRPILERERWLNLNGVWQLKEDPKDEGLRGHWFDQTWSDATDIVVPFPIESEASGVHNVEPASIIWYQREFSLPSDWKERICLRIGACDHWARVFINGQEVGQHRGGYAPFSFDISHALKPGINRITIRVQDSLSWTQPRGKQAGTTRWPIDYDSVSGIWQTVWLEPLPGVSIESTAYRYSCATRELTYQVFLSEQLEGEVEIEILDGTEVVATATVETALRAEARVAIVIDQPRLWSPDSPTLYQVKLKLRNAETGECDVATSYLGLREVSVEEGRLHLNGEDCYLRGVLDQGYFPKGWYTAMSDDELRRDVELTLAMGFNCARKHQKAEDPRYLYWADRLGLLVWAEMPSGRVFSSELVESLTREWTDLVKRDRGHPSVIAWVPFNESWGVWHQSTRPEQRAFVDATVALTKSLDQSRLVVGNDGWEFSSGDLWTLHLYKEEHDLANRLSRLIENPESSVTDEYGGQNRVGALPGADVSGLPILLTECGGIGMGQFSDDDFSYGNCAQSEAELEQRIEEALSVIRSIAPLQGFVWTQLTDVQQEVNGLLYFDRRPKLPLETLCRLFQS